MCNKAVKDSAATTCSSYATKTCIKKLPKAVHQGPKIKPKRKLKFIKIEVKAYSKTKS